MENLNLNEVTDRIAGSITLKAVIVGILALILLIPTVMINNVIDERNSFQQETEKTVSAGWGTQQLINGPFLTIPYSASYADGRGGTVSTLRLLHLTPEVVTFDGKIETSIKTKGIYDVILYESIIETSGIFKLPKEFLDTVDSASVYYDDAYLSIGISDQTGINSIDQLKWNDGSYKFKVGIPEDDITNSGVYTAVKIDPKTSQYTFSFNLDIKGHEKLDFIPVGQETHVTLSSIWPDPSFNGNFLPTHEINDAGFTAEWNIFHLSRNIPEFWTGAKKWELDQSFGVNLIQPVNEYQKNTRSIKYSFLVICLTFLVFFLTEIIKKKRLHPFQYVMAGLALILFYILLISLSEHLGFNLAYLISSTLTALMITLYMKAIFRGEQVHWVLLLFFTIIYGFIYIILQLEGFALLTGAMGLFIALSATMYLTRNINWYQMNTKSK